MGTISTLGIDAWKVKRVLWALNGFTSASALSNAVVDDPNYGTGSTGIGTTVAQRILDRRATLPANRFNDVDQLDNIDGMSQDKFVDMVYSFVVPAAEQFKLAMYDGLLLTNFILEYDRLEFAFEADFLEVVDDPIAFKNLIAHRVHELTIAHTNDDSKATTAILHVADANFEPYFSGNIGSYALALWFFRFDEDNWFSYDRVREKTEGYLASIPTVDDRIELRMLHGFENAGFLANAISPTGLPVAVNYLEQCITIWTGQLND